MELDYKYLTKDCDECPCRDDDICLWGTHDKRLVTNRYHGPRHCEYRDRPAMRDELTRRESRWVGKSLPEKIMQGRLIN